MSNWFNVLFAKKLSEALKIKTPQRIPRSGEEGAKGFDVMDAPPF
ncbi:hypothetical protein [Vibrio natriegens]|nr:hypothetical protein [Vibrio natriegens]